MTQIATITHSAGTKSASASSRFSRDAIAPNDASNHTEASPRSPAWMRLKWRSYSASFQDASSGIGVGCGVSATARCNYDKCFRVGTEPGQRRAATPGSRSRLAQVVAVRIDAW
jgi:hypothetical protein